MTLVSSGAEADGDDGLSGGFPWGLARVVPLTIKWFVLISLHCVAPKTFLCAANLTLVLERELMSLAMGAS